ncbi:MAG: DUF1489 domain-containing protein [Azospirillaceae bacterium]
MTVHLVKTAAGIADLEALAARQALRRGIVDGRPVVAAYTRRKPRRAEEVVDGGSIYWIVKRAIRVRQRVVDLVDAVDGEGQPFCEMLLDPELVETAPMPRRPIQGWRYLDPTDAPRDREAGAPDDDRLPDHLVRDLQALGLM